MNCLDFRRLMLAEPRRLSEEQKAHMAGCRACQEHAARSDEFESVLGSALEVPVPEGLAERILLEHAGEHPRNRFGWLALAASLFLGVAVSTLYFRVLEPRGTAGAVIAHVVAEPAALRVKHEVLPDAVREAFAVAGGELTGPIGTVTHLTPCDVDGRRGRHMVLDTEHGQVTLVMLPEHRRVPSRTVVSSHGWTAAVLPAPQGNMSIVVDRREELEQVERLIASRVTWSG